MDATIVTVHPFGSKQPLTLDLAALYEHFQQEPDLRQRRGVRYPLAVLLTIALWAKLTGASQLRAIAEWARERQGELAARFALPRAAQPKCLAGFRRPTTDNGRTGLRRSSVVGRRNQAGTCADVY